MTAQTDTPLAAVVLAAGRSSRMGQAKLALPWGNTTIIGQVVAALAGAGVAEIVVVTGANEPQVQAALAKIPEQTRPLVRTAFNPEHDQDYMILSLQTGLGNLSARAGAALIALGDQPQIQSPIVQEVIRRHIETGAPLVIPSYQMRRGHPWLAARSLWAGLLALRPPETTRAFLNAHASEISYVDAPNDSILRDLDTPEDYARERPAAGFQSIGDVDPPS